MTLGIRSNAIRWQAAQKITARQKREPQSTQT